MGKKQNEKKAALKTGQAAPQSVDSAVIAPALPLFEQFRIQALILAIVGLVFYFNTFQSGFALDDRPIIVENEYVQDGITGIPKILTSDAFASYLEQRNSGKMLTGGRYRPLSIVTFAIEQQFLGMSSAAADVANATKGMALSSDAVEKLNHDMHYRHVVNVLLYILSAIVLLYLLRNIVFPRNHMLPFIAALLFVIHPIHSEVVANIKSRDEIMSFLFIGLTFIYAFRYYDQRKKSMLAASMLCYFLALLSKEYALTLVGLLPLSFYLFRNERLGKSFGLFLPYLLPLGIYVAMRFSAESGLREIATPDITTDPYLFATSTQKIASIIAVPIHYLRLLILPYPLSSDYSYAQLPYNSFGDAIVWLSLLIYAAIIAAFFWLVRKQHVLAFAVAVFLFNLALVSNVFVDLGATMGERLIFHSSLGFVIVVAFLLYETVQKIQSPVARNTVLAVSLGLVTLLSANVTIARNADWKNDQTLFLKDVKTSPNSLLILCNAGSACVDLGLAATDSAQRKQWFETGINYLDRALVISHTNPRGWLNKGACLYYLGHEEQAFSAWDSLKKYNPGDPILPYLQTVTANYYSKQGLNYGMANQSEKAIASFLKALEVTPRDPDVLYNLGYAYFSLGRYQEAINELELSLKIRPGTERVVRLYELVKEKMK